ncbi:GH116 family glycosyl hydrolase [Coraliomargarita sp. SDUM461003]|uniref:GH116 family glycosyl hydrolase n=1 Tax=Thalassobacterium maritimum TaxID=3041265 RepID=A0ABU1AXA6_9BACT|nr:GH116 family glycosyl-hydrolase [Coraliomargarita sp. SDUM461003]MDQ8208232.1 GH116 family glycosyl hydrolase [Coraliomargarita sp. SDUM461003]
MNTPTKTSDAFTGRRDFIKASGLTAAMLMVGRMNVMAGPFEAKDFDKIIPADKKLSADWIKSLYARGQATTVKAGKVDYIGMPINGMGTGQVYLSGDGELWCWNLTAEKDKKHTPKGLRYMKPDMAQAPSGQGFAVKVNGKVHTLDSGGFRDVTFTNQYPMAQVDYTDEAIPVGVQLEAYTPFIPLNRDESSYPVIVMRYTVTNHSAKTQEVGIAGWIENLWAGKGAAQSVYRPLEDIATVECSSAGKNGNAVALGVFGQAAADFVEVNQAKPGAEAAFTVGNSDTEGTSRAASIGRQLSLKPGESQTVSFAVSWRIPQVNYGVGFGKKTAPGSYHYATQWPTAADAAAQVASRETELYGTTKQWTDTWYDSSLPYWFLERAFIPIDCMQTQMVQRVYAKGETEDIYNMEEGVRCCPGNCTHVWNYAQGLARIFPEIERECRDRIEYGRGFDPKNGMIFFRYSMKDGAKGRDDALDGTCGTIIRVLRESQMTTDYSFLASIWDRVKLSMDFVIKEWDADEDGILSGAQHNTLDEPWYGKVPWLINVYHAALKASAVMARQMDQPAVAERYERIVAKGAPKMVKELWNEEFGYFVHIPPQDETQMHGSTNGCHIDQVLGDSWLYEIGLDPILPREKTRKALQALWKYNFTPDVAAFRKVMTNGRWYAGPGDAGLVMTSFPHGKVEPKSGNENYAGYLNECMTGFEWQVAAHMLREDMIEEAMAIGKAIYDRYSADKRNPYNEIECSDHYSRAMASYGTYLAACGYRYDGPEAKLGFGPKLSPEDFKAAFTTAEGWGRFTQKVEGGQQNAVLEVGYGRLHLKEFSLDQVKGTKAKSATVAVNGQPVEARFQMVDGCYVLKFESGITIQKGESLQVSLV